MTGVTLRGAVTESLCRFGQYEISELTDASWRLYHDEVDRQ